MDRFDQATQNTTDVSLLAVISKARGLLQRLNEATLGAYIQTWSTTDADTQDVVLVFTACVVFVNLNGATIFTYTPVPENPLMPPKISSDAIASFGANDTDALVSMIQAVAQ